MVETLFYFKTIRQMPLILSSLSKINDKQFYDSMQNTVQININTCVTHVHSITAQNIEILIAKY